MLRWFHVKCFLRESSLQGEVALLHERLAHALRGGERLEHDLEMLRVDHARAVEHLGNLATRPRAGNFGDMDPFREQEGPPEWLTPKEDEVTDPDSLTRVHERADDH